LQEALLVTGFSDRSNSEQFVSTYASTHPWEDWAETWAHYLHIVDTVEMASAFGIRRSWAARQARASPEFYPVRPGAAPLPPR
jgi:hypothetical protein